MNKREHLGYFWKATFNDDSVISQFNDDETENLFKDVDDRMSDLVKFEVVSNDKKESYEVDLVKQFIKGPDTNENVEGANVKLVYFRRNKVRGEVGTGNVLDTRVTHMLGLETDTDKKVFEVTPKLLMSKKNIEVVFPEKAERKIESRVNITSKVGEMRNELESNL